MKDQKKIKGTTKLLMAVLDVTMVEFGPISSLLLLGRERGREGSGERRTQGRKVRGGRKQGVSTK